MADGRDLECWNNHAAENRADERKPFESSHPFLRDTLLGLQGVTTVVDIGCGPGFWINLFEGFTYTGFDQSPKMLEFGRELSPDAEFVQGNARKLVETFGDRKFDLVFTSAVLQHNRHAPDKTEIVQGMHEIIRPDGYYLCTEDTCRNDNHPECVDSAGCNRGPEYTFKAEGWRQYMLDLGFEMVEYSRPSEYLYKRI
jgi:SAM-dependent methyltransferase